MLQSGLSRPCAERFRLAPARHGLSRPTQSSRPRPPAMASRIPCSRLARARPLWPLASHASISPAPARYGLSHPMQSSRPRANRFSLLRRTPPFVAALRATPTKQRGHSPPRRMPLLSCRHQAAICRAAAAAHFHSIASRRVPATSTSFLGSVRLSTPSL